MVDFPLPCLITRGHALMNINEPQIGILHDLGLKLATGCTTPRPHLTSFFRGRLALEDGEQIM